MVPAPKVGFPATAFPSTESQVAVILLTPVFTTRRLLTLLALATILKLDVIVVAIEHPYELQASA
jgi:hypothetical protein